MRRRGLDFELADSQRGGDHGEQHVGRLAQRIGMARADVGCGAAHRIAGEGGGEQADGQDEYRAENPRQVLHEAVDGRRQAVEPERLGRGQQERQHQDPEHDPTEDVARGLVHVDVFEHVCDPGTLAQAVEADDGQEPADHGRGDLRDDVAEDEDDQGAGEVRQEGGDFAPGGQQGGERPLAEVVDGIQHVGIS